MERLEDSAKKNKRRYQLRELNIRKNRGGTQSISKTPSMVSLENEPLSTNNFQHPSTSNQAKQNFNVNGVSNRPLTGPSNKVTVDEDKPLMENGELLKTTFNDPEMVVNSPVKKTEKKGLKKIKKNIVNTFKKLTVNGVKNDSNNARKTLSPIKVTKQSNLPENPQETSRKSMEPVQAKLSMPATSSQTSGNPKGSRKSLPATTAQKPAIPKRTRKSMIPMLPVSVPSLLVPISQNIVNTDLSEAAEKFITNPIFVQQVLQQAGAPSVPKPRRLVWDTPNNRVKRQTMLELWDSFEMCIVQKLNEIDVTKTNEGKKVNKDTITSAMKSTREHVRNLLPTRKNFRIMTEILLQKSLKKP